MAAQDQLKVDVRHEADRAVLCLQGELDLASAPLLEKQIDSIQLGTTPTVVLDLQKLQFIDSTGLRAILSAQARLRERGGELAVTPGSSQVQRLLAITRADEHLRIVSSPDEMLV